MPRDRFLVVPAIRWALQSGTVARTMTTRRSVCLCSAIFVVGVTLLSGQAASPEQSDWPPRHPATPLPVSSVTDAMLRDPSPNDWLMFRRTYDGWGYSPLDQIDRDNVGELRLAWVWSMEDGRNQPTPLVHDGVMFLANPNGVVQALDARTGEGLWEHRRRFPDGFAGGDRSPQKRRVVR